MLRRGVAPGLVVVLAAAALAGCGSSATKHSSTTSTPPTAGSSASGCRVATRASSATPTGLHGTVRVLAAASLTESFTEIARGLEAAHPGVKVELSFGPSSGLVAQVNNGAPADVLATADTQSMALARKPGSVDQPVIFACNRLEIITAKGNPKHLRSLADLGTAGVRFVLCAKGVPCGDLGVEALAKAGVHARPAGYQPDVKHVVAQVEVGEVDAGLVYVSDVLAAKGKASGVPIPAADNVVTSYPIAVVKASGNRAAARAFVDSVLSARSQQVLARHGFGSS